MPLTLGRTTSAVRNTRPAHVAPAEKGGAAPMTIVDLQTAPSTVPYLNIRVPLAGDAELTFHCRSWEDELALRSHLRHGHVLDDLAGVLGRLLDAIDIDD